MNTVLRLLFAWLMLAALSLPAAAAGTPPCAGHGAMAASLANHMADGKAAAVHQQDQAGTATHATCAQHASQHDGGHHGKCSTCNACCVGAALMPATPVRPAPPMQTSAGIPFDAGRLTSVDLDHPERPPRTLRA